MEDYTIIDQQKGRIIFARQRQVPAGYFESDTSVTDLQLKPISMHEVHTPQNVNYAMCFGDSPVRVLTARPGGKLSTKQYRMQSGYFEDNMIGYIWGYLQLKKGCYTSWIISTRIPRFPRTPIRLNMYSMTAGARQPISKSTAAFSGLRMGARPVIYGLIKAATKC